MKKYLFIFLGSVSLFLGFLGLFTPGIPTTPFVLLTGYLYARSSPRLYARLKKNKITGACLRSVEEGMSWQMRLASISFMWVMVLITAFGVFESGSTMRYVMLGLGVIGTISQMIALRKKKKVKEVEVLISESEDINLDKESITEKNKEVSNTSIVYEFTK